MNGINTAQAFRDLARLLTFVAEIVAGAFWEMT